MELVVTFGNEGTHFVGISCLGFATWDLQADSLFEHRSGDNRMVCRLGNFLFELTIIFPRVWRYSYIEYGNEHLSRSDIRPGDLADNHCYLRCVLDKRTPTMYVPYCATGNHIHGI